VASPARGRKASPSVSSVDDESAAPAPRARKAASAPGAESASSRGRRAATASSASSRDRSSSDDAPRSAALAEDPRPASPAGGPAFDDNTVSSKEDEALVPANTDKQRAALLALATQNKALAEALQATPRDATVASAEIRVLEARLSACRRDAQEARQRHRQALAAMNLELGALRDKNESDRRGLVARLRDESLIVNELTKRCDALTRELRGTDVSPLSATANKALRSSREAVRTLIVSPDEVDPAPRARGAFSELLDSNAALLEELGVV
jgi:hypothetical protein